MAPLVTNFQLKPCSGDIAVKVEILKQVLEDNTRSERTIWQIVFIYFAIKGNSLINIKIWRMFMIREFCTRPRCSWWTFHQTQIYIDVSNSWKSSFSQSLVHRRLDAHPHSGVCFFLMVHSYFHAAAFSWNFCTTIMF